MRVIFNPDKKVVEKIQQGLKQTGGYCPCRIEKTRQTKCMCEEFRKQIADKNFEGFCHCRLYYKYK
ncbi:ferredoxin thioredoxin reductase catalytic beta chain [bacterium]|nr:ferredoxin thioredoxin reductase catalytic beta chain [bacterium]